MTDDHYQYADDGRRVLNTAMVAVMLIAAGLGLMAWEEYRDVRSDTVTVSVFQKH